MNTLQTIPTMESVYRATIDDLLRALHHVAEANDPTTAATAAHFFTRPIGAFGDRVLMIQAQDNPDKPLLQVKIVTIPADMHVEPPLWDVTRPATRRTWSSAIITPSGGAAA